MSQQLTWTNQWRWNQSGLVWNGVAPTTDKAMNYHVSLAFAQLPDPSVIDFAVGVHDGLLANVATFATPPVTVVALKTAYDSFSSLLAVANKGSVAQTAAKDASHDVLVGLLRQLGAYVEGVAQGDGAKIRLAGFQAIKHERGTQSVLDKPAIKAVENSATTQLKVRVIPVKNAHAYMVETSAGTGPWQSAGGGTQARGIILQGLTPGTLYKIRVRAIGGSSGFSDWSDTVEHMCT